MCVPGTTSHTYITHRQTCASLVLPVIHTSHTDKPVRPWYYQSYIHHTETDLCVPGTTSHTYITQRQTCASLVLPVIHTSHTDKPVRPWYYQSYIHHTQTGLCVPGTTSHTYITHRQTCASLVLPVIHTSHTDKHVRPWYYQSYIQAAHTYSKLLNRIGLLPTHFQHTQSCLVEERAACLRTPPPRPVQGSEGSRPEPPPECSHTGTHTETGT